MHVDTRFGTVVAIFPTRACADEASRELHRFGVRHTWLGEGHRPQRGKTLFEALSAHGVNTEDAREVDRVIGDDEVVLVAEDVPQDVDAIAIATHHGGTTLVFRPPQDPLEQPRLEAAHRHPVSGDLNINDIRHTAMREVPPL